MIKQYINGKLVEGKGQVMTVYNPANDEVVASFKGADRSQALEALDAAQEAFETFKMSPILERINYLYKLRDAVLAEKDKIVDMIIAESGRPLAAALGDYNWFVASCTFYAEEARRVYGTTFPNKETPYGGVYHITEFRPLGVTVAHLAWNYPLGNLSIKLCPSIASGCTCVLKPSSQTPVASLYIGEICERIGLPAGIVNIIAGKSSEVATPMNQSTIPKMISLIGSSETGLRILQEGATSIKKYALECGGNAPVIVMDDVDIPEVAKAIVAKKVGFSGQTCVNYNRIYVQDNIYDALCDAVKEELKKVKIGAGRDEGYIMGPLIDKAARDRMLDLIKDAVGQGAKLLCGGEIPAGFEKGAFMTPALLKDVTDDMRVSNEEIFGPIIPMQPFSDFDEALKKANNTIYGLSAYFYGHDAREIGKAVEAFEAGEIFINNAPGSDQTPHPGTKQSGLGCDKSKWSLAEYFDFKQVSIIL